MSKSNAIATSGMDKQWQAESDLRCIVEAKKIMKDKGRMAAVRAQAKKQLDEAKQAQEMLAK